MSIDSLPAACAAWPAARTLRAPHRLSTLAVAIASLTCAAALAQTPAPTPAPAPAPAAAPATKPGDTDKSPQVVDKVEIKASASDYDERREDTATKIVVTSEEIRKFGDTQILDVMKRLPGVTVQNNAIRLRGLGNGYTQILIDGERPPPGFSIDNLSPELVERIEIIRAATAEFSTQAIAGTVNIVMKKKYTVSKREFNAGWYSGTGYTSQNLNINIADSAGSLAYSIGSYAGHGTFGNTTTSTTRGTDAAGTPNLEREQVSSNRGNNRYAGMYSTLAWTLPGGDSLTMNPSLNFYRYRNRDNGLTTYLFGETTPYPVSQGRNGGQGWSVGNTINWIKKLGDGAKLDSKLMVHFGGRDNDADSRSFDYDGTPTLVRSTESPSRDNRVAFSGKYSTPIIEGHSLVAGWDLGLNRQTASTRTEEWNIAGPAIDSNDGYRARVSKMAFFAQDEWNVTPNWSVYFGFRWEGVNTETSGDGFATASNRSSVASPLFQTLWKFPDKSGRQLRLALTRTYKAPETGNLVPRVFRSTVNTSTSPDWQMGNPALKPELATGVDVAYEHFFAKGASMSLSGSLRRLTDYNTRGIFLLDGRWLSRPFNNGDASTRSLEFDLKVPLQSVLPTAPPIDFRFNVARNFSRVEEVPGPNNRLDQQVPVSGTLGLDYRMRGGMVTAGASFSFKTGGEVRITPTQINYSVPKRELEMYVLYKYTPKLQFRARIANALRQDQITATNYFDATGAQRTYSVMPTQMNIGASVKLDF